ncbi:MAG: FecR domain-containing protein [Bacteroidetes bacterium]|nr:FecR domain-containing protein [Bacteroidota bacterium]
MLLKKMTGALTDEESATLEAWRISSPANQQKYDELTDRHSLQRKMRHFDEADIRAEQMEVPEIDNTERQVPVIPVTRRRHLLPKWSWAAAVILLVVAAGYLYTITQKTQLLPADAGKQAQTDINPGGNKAILTLADGSSIALDSAAKGELAMQGNNLIIKEANGKVTYRQKGVSAGSVLTNTLSTPKGGQYQLTLPDGTNVWLNAASSITFPTAFTGDQRKVRISGEVYFEVAKNKRQPFIAEVDDRQSVEVLGTQFNVNGYADEAAIQTTLIAGSVRIQSGMPSTGRNQRTSVILQPGQQSVLASGQTSNHGEGIVVKPGVDIDKVMAWKNGLFNFNGADVPSVMRQLERWYDIHVRYEGAVPAMRFKGELDRGVNLSEILKILPEIGIRYRMDGRTLIVL